MQDLNDLNLFVAVVTYGGFSAAARRLDAPKSKLRLRQGLVHIIFTSHRGLLPGGCAVLDFLAEALSPKSDGCEAAF